MKVNVATSDLDGITNKELSRWLALFVVEAHNQQGDEYRGGTLYSLCSGSIIVEC